MDLLSLIGQVTKRKGDLFSQAETLARKAKSQEKLEKKMLSESETLVKALRTSDIKWDEYYRSLVENSLISALAAVCIGAKGSNLVEIMERAWPSLIGDILPPLQSFLNETKKLIESGILRVGEDIQDFADRNLDEEELGEEDGEYIWDKNQVVYPVGANLSPENKPVTKKKPTWKGISSRVARYLSSPTYSYSTLGQHLVKINQGHSLMKRVAVHDRRACPDCLRFDQMGWQPIGSLPIPGKQCRCYDRCRCSVEYR